METKTVAPEVMTKIKNLLKMAEHPNSNEYEAAIALEKAQSLLLEYQLSRASIKCDGEGDDIEPDKIGVVDGVELAGFDWKVTILGVIAKSMLCKTIRSPQKKSYHLFGTKTNIDATLEMWRWIIPQVINLNRDRLHQYKSSGGYESTRSWNIGFYYGITLAIKERLEKPMTEFASGNGMAIVLYNTKAVAEAIHKVYPYLTSTHKRYVRSNEGLSYGKQAGRDINFTSNRMLSNNLRLA
jgi:hypothetical protein